MPTPTVTAPAPWFTGAAWIDAVAEPEGPSRTRVDSVHFAPGARTVWHRHPLGQVLVITQGVGSVQRRGGPVETVRAGDSVRIAPGEWHWHGATPTTSMTHLAVEEIPEDGAGTERDRPVTDAEYGGESDAPVSRTVVLDVPLAAPVATHRVEVRRIRMAAGQAAGLHVHNGPVFGGVEAGSVVYQVEGAPETVLGPGDVFHEPAGVRIARFDALDDGVTFLAYFLLGAGQEAELAFPDV
jgi:quercetin dioxygenase-like cupin family protein